MPKYPKKLPIKPRIMPTGAERLLLLQKMSRDGSGYVFKTVEATVLITARMADKLSMVAQAMTQEERKKFLGREVGMMLKDAQDFIHKKEEK